MAGSTKEDAPGGVGVASSKQLRVSEETLQEMLSVEAQMERHPIVRTKLEELFFKWLSFDETDEIIRTAINEVLSNGTILAQMPMSPSTGGLSPRSAKHTPPHVPGLALGSGAAAGPFVPNLNFSAGLGFAQSSPPKSPTRASRELMATDDSSGNPHKSAISLALRSPKRKMDHQLKDANNTADMYSPNKRREKVGGELEGTPLTARGGGTTPTAAQDAVPFPGGQKGPMRMRRRSELPAFFLRGEGGRGRGRRMLDDSLDLKLDAISNMFDPQEANGGLSVHDFVHVTKVLCKFPSFFNVPLFERILATFGTEGGGGAAPEAAELNAKLGADGGARISKEVFLRFWKAEIEPFDLVDRFFRLVKQPGREFIEREDFLPYMRELLRFHPGLEFLENSEFQEKYAITVIARIFYSVNSSRTGRITARELRRSNLVEAFLTVDEQEDINAVLDYFSYEHFYVLYCRFWELDTDRDMKISEEDLLKYNDHSLSSPIVQRIFEVGDRPFPQARSAASPDRQGQDAAAAAAAQPWTRNARHMMTYEDFIYFMLSEEDKGVEPSLRYWFTCCDLDEDGRLTPGDLRFFYQVQAHRMDCLGHEPISFEDILCQLSDMIKPATPGVILMSDLTRPDVIHIGGALFDVLFNLNKFFMFEQRDPFSERQKREDNFECDWDRFAFFDYSRLAAEEDAEAADGDLMEVVDAGRFGWITSDGEAGDLDSIGSSL
eukprot:CAMPEP_0118880336 /NCGR_PEP_ID=MMETSP1163-20130328/19933_1 /TAXON_ID=124430 /ORGANISM="Phaeomonas parva, Strain CCMP2877" /LENGTH=720 /DNA_ID=CAMNT_0006816711 /DNA_START=358 /DNA_END=2520 /DNA_ORIENTATION=+